jgi:hypothetical protein
LEYRYSGWIRLLRAGEAFSGLDKPYLIWISLTPAWIRPLQAGEALSGLKKPYLDWRSLLRLGEAFSSLKNPSPP